MAKQKTPDATTAASVTLAAPYAFYDDAGDLQAWQAGYAESDPVKIAVLIQRGAPLEDTP